MNEAIEKATAQFAADLGKLLREAAVQAVRDAFAENGEELRQTATVSLGGKPVGFVMDPVVHSAPSFRFPDDVPSPKKGRPVDPSSATQRALGMVRAWGSMGAALDSVAALIGKPPKSTYKLLHKLAARGLVKRVADRWVAA